MINIIVKTFLYKFILSKLVFNGLVFDGLKVDGLVVNGLIFKFWFKINHLGFVCKSLLYLTYSNNSK